MRSNSLHPLLTSATLLSVSAAMFALGGCADDSANPKNSEDDLAHSGADTTQWFYDGPLPALDNPRVTLSQDGHTAHVSGLVPVGVTVPAPSSLPTQTQYYRLKTVNGRTQLDAVYPMATADLGQYSNAAPSSGYVINDFAGYRPNGTVTSVSNPNPHFVTWGGYPFVPYAAGDRIAMHGPITYEKNDPDAAWFLRRGRVSGGCNRMLGEHVVELAHLIGGNMHRVFDAFPSKAPIRNVPVTAQKDYDKYEGELIDVDYPTDVGVVRPAKAGRGASTMFGSWIGSNADGHDLPAPMKWEGGVTGKLYDAKEHVSPKTWVCSVPWKRSLVGKQAGPNFCACVASSSNPATCLK